MNTFLDQIKDIMEIEDRDIEMSDNFKEYEEWDSMSSLLLTSMLDEEYGVVFNTNELSQINTIQELYDQTMKRKES